MRSTRDLAKTYPSDGIVTQLGSLGIPLQVLGETLDFQRLEPISRYEVHLDRKFERAVSMLIRLRELRQFNQAG